MGAVSIIWSVLVLAFNPQQNMLGDSISALGFGICFYYGLTGFACAIYYRRELLRSAKNFFMAGVVPLLGGADAARHLRQGIPRLQPEGLQLRQADPRDPDADLSSASAACCSAWC